MEIIIYFAVSCVLALAALVASSKGWVRVITALFLAFQVAQMCRVVMWSFDETSAQFFTFDALGVLFFVLMLVVAAFVFVHSFEYLKDNILSEYRVYFALLMLLVTSVGGVYFSNNVAVTWVFLEATTLCSAGIIYHRRTAHSLEATWKYIFVCSTGIAMAYLGILLLGSVTRGQMAYADMASVIDGGNPLYLKVAFLLIVTGYSCKMEVFPLYTAGVDANFAAPSPASAFISTALVNAGFLAIFRVYKVVAVSSVAEWAQHVLLIVGLLSLSIGALFLRRTNNYKRFLAYSTVENMGIVAIGLGIGGVGVWAALFHVVCHTLIKSSLFLQIAVVRQIYNGYRINRIGDYININKVGAVGLILGIVMVAAFPPSPLFVSELLVMKQTIMSGRWWIVGVMLVLLCIVIYSLFSRVLRLCYQPNQDALHTSATDKLLSWSALCLTMAAMVVGVWQPQFLTELIDSIVKF